MQPDMFALIDHAFDDAHPLWLDLAQTHGLASAGGQAIHSLQREVTQACSLNIGLREIIEARSQHKTPLLHLLDYAVALQCLQQAMQASLAHTERPREIRERHSLFRSAQEVEQPKGAFHHRRGRLLRQWWNALLFLFSILN